MFPPLLSGLSARCARQSHFGAGKEGRLTAVRQGEGKPQRGEASAGLSIRSVKPRPHFCCSSAQILVSCQLSRMSLTRQQCRQSVMVSDGQWWCSVHSAGAARGGATCARPSMSCGARGKGVDHPLAMPLPQHFCLPMQLLPPVFTLAHKHPRD